MSLKRNIIEEIELHGPMNVARYMELCNSHYYATRDPFGVAGDFITAPEISQIFGEMIAIWAIGRWEELRRPQRFALVELGPGRGTLMADLLRAAKVEAGFKPEIHFVETSPALTQIQQDKIPGVVHHLQIPFLDIPTIVIANEFFDALPVQQFSGNLERKIDTDDESLYFNLPEENIREVSPASIQTMAAIAATASAGVIIDYGYVIPGGSSTLQAVKAHKFHSVLATPGEADLTALVDFASLAKVLKKPYKIVTQNEFLLAHGADVRARILGKEQDLHRLIAPDQMGELFKVLCF